MTFLWVGGAAVSQVWIAWKMNTFCMLVALTVFSLLSPSRDALILCQLSVIQFLHFPQRQRLRLLRLSFQAIICCRCTCTAQCTPAPAKCATSNAIWALKGSSKLDENKAGEYLRWQAASGISARLRQQTRFSIQIAIDNEICAEPRKIVERRHS